MELGGKILYSLLSLFGFSYFLMFLLYLIYLLFLHIPVPSFPVPNPNLEFQIRVKLNNSNFCNYCLVIEQIFWGLQQKLIWIYMELGLPFFMN